MKYSVIAFILAAGSLVASTGMCPSFWAGLEAQAAIDQPKALSQSSTPGSERSDGPDSLSVTSSSPAKTPGHTPSAAENSARVEWAATDLRGAAIKVPATKTTALLFLLPDQPQSQQALEQLRTIANGSSDTQFVIIVNGKDAAAYARHLVNEAKLAWPVVADTEYAASGKFSVHVWPTTVVIRADGHPVAHLAGVPKAYARDLESYLAFAAGKITETALHERLESHQTVVDSPRQMAERHLSVAKRLLEKGLIEQAKVELSQGLKLAPTDTPLLLSMAEVLLTLRDAPAAMELLNRADEKAAGPWRLKILRGRALVAMEKWTEAEETLQRAVQLNPQPAEAFYELGKVYEHQGKWREAAQAYRRAFESTDTGKKVTTTRPTSPNPQ